MPLEEEVVDHRAITDEDEPNFRVLVARVLDNANIDPATHLRAACVAEAQPVAPGPALIDANEDEIIYELTFKLPDGGLAPPIAPDGMAVVPHNMPDAHAFEPNPAKDVGQNSIQANQQRLKGLLRKPRYPRQSTGTQLKNKSTGTRKSNSTQPFWSTGTQLRNRSTGTCKSSSTLMVPSRSTSTPVGNNAWLGTARLVKLTWQVGVSGNKGTKQ